MKCLVTGAAGFIGSTLSERLIGEGHEVIGLDCFTDYYDPKVKRRNVEALRGAEGFTLVEGDMVELDLPTLLAGVDWVFHQAGQPGVRMSWGRDFEVYTRQNILATQKLLEAAKDSSIRRLVYASSSSVYGDAPELPLSEKARPQPVSPYGVTKLAAEHLCYLYHVNFGVPTVSLRYFTVYGPRQRPDMGFNKFSRAALSGEEIVIYGDGEQTRDFTFVSDAVTANMQAAQVEGAVGGVFNVGGGSRVSVNEVLGIFRDLVGSINVRYSENQKGDVRHTMSDTTAARAVLGYAPKVGIREGLAREVEWMRSMM
ncbi:MAG: NAD-dependent epimerase/dehydratase family protein [Armatimonadota bacterium]